MLRLLVVLLLRPTYCTAWDTGGAGWKADPTRPQESQTNAVVCGSSSLEYEYVPSPAFFFYHSCWQFCVLKQRTDLLPALQPVEYRPAEGCNVDQSNSSTRTWLGAWDYIPVAGGYPDGWVRENDSWWVITNDQLIAGSIQIAGYTICTCSCAPYVHH